MDNIRSGDPRTLRDHQDMALRSAIRAEAENTSLVAREYGLRTATVVGIGNRGEVQIDLFSDGRGGGPWLRNLNHTQPFPGEMVIWGYVDGAPAVLGPLTGEHRPWRIPTTGMADVMHFDDLETSRGTFYGTSQLTRVVSGSGSVAVNSGSANHPGQVRLSTGATSGSNAWLEQETYLLRYESLDEVEFMFSLSDAPGAGIAVGLSGNMGTGANSVFAYYDSSVAAPYSEEMTALGLSSGGWGSAYLEGSGSLLPSIPIISAHWYKVVLRRLAVGEWMITVADVSEDPQIEGVALVKGLTSGACSPTLYVWNTVAANKRLDADYLWWSKRRVQRI